MQLTTCPQALTLAVFLKSADQGRAFLFTVTADPGDTIELLHVYANDRLCTLGVTPGECHIVTL